MSPQDSPPLEGHFPLHPPLSQGPSTPITPPPPYTEYDDNQERRQYILHDPRNNNSTSPRGPMTVPVIVITHANSRCAFTLCKKHTVDGSGYCRKHKCHTESCQNYREIGDGQLYCSKHCCLWPGCSSRTKGSSRFCAGHKCRLSSCPAGRLSSTEKSFCSFHVCRRPGCLGCCEANSEHCKKHLCQARSCPRGATAYSPLCRRHKCEIRGCRALRSIHAECCSRHQCEVGDCSKRQVDRSRYCVSHKCASDGCLIIRQRGLPHCAEHKAEHKDRSRGRPPRTMPDDEVFNVGDSRQDMCEVPRRLRPQKKSIGKYSTYVCRWRGCLDSALRRDGYCRSHTCALSDCSEEIFEDGAFVGECCRRHTCTAEDCLLRVSKGAYCSYHECRGRPCPNSRFWTDDRGAYREHVGCRFHTCIQRGCYDPTARPGGFCERHDACGWSLQRCVNPRLGRSSYCDGHTCRKSDCVSPRMLDGEYCPNHACRGSIPCPRKAEMGSMYCARHRCSEGDTRLERISDQPLYEDHNYSRGMPPLYDMASQKRFVIPLR